MNSFSPWSEVLLDLTCGGPETARALAALRRYARHATAFQVLEPGYTYWFTPFPEGEGLIAYSKQGRYRVVAGHPVVPLESLAEATAQFVAAARERRERVIFFCAGQELVDALAEHPEMSASESLMIGSQPVWNPTNYTTAGRERRTLRAQVRRAERKGVTVRRLNPEEVLSPKMRSRLEGVVKKWKTTRGMSIMGFMVDICLFHFPKERRYYLAEKSLPKEDRGTDSDSEDSDSEDSNSEDSNSEDSNSEGDTQLEVVGLLAAVPVYGRSGWFFEDIIREPSAPNGTVELLIHRAMSDAQDTGDQFATLGLAPLADLDTSPGPRRWMRLLMAWCYESLNSLYGFKSLHSFKARFQPDEWQPQYLLSPGGPIRFGAMESVLRAFVGGGFVRFALDTACRLLGRIPPFIWRIALFSLLGGLSLWTALLSFVNIPALIGEHRPLWVCFNLLILGALSLLVVSLRRPSPRLRWGSVPLAGLSFANAGLLLAQGMTSPPPDLPTLFLWLVGLAGPIVTGVLLSLLSIALRPRE